MKTSGTVYDVSSFSSNNGSTITFVGSVLINLEKGTIYLCNAPANVCTVTTNSDSDVTIDGGDITITDADIDNSGIFQSLTAH